MIFGHKKYSGPQESSRREGASASPAEAVAASEDIIFDFFDFFDKTADQLYSFLIYKTSDKSIAIDALSDLYLSILRKRRFFWWKKAMTLSTLIYLADQSVPVTKLSVPDGQRDDQVETYLDISLTESQRNAAQWNDESVNAFLKSIPQVILEKGEKSRLRMTLLEKFREYESSSLRYVMPIVGAGAAMGIFLIVSATTLAPVSAGTSRMQLAAAQVMLIDNDLEQLKNIREAQNIIDGMTAYYAEKHLAHISVDLAPYAINQEVAMEKEINAILRKIGTKPFLVSWRPYLEISESQNLPSVRIRASRNSGHVFPIAQASDSTSIAQ